MNLIRPVKFKTVPQPLTPGTIDIIFATQNFAAFFGHLFDRVPVRVLTFTIQPHEKKKAYKIRGYDFGVHFDLTVIVGSENFSA